MGSIGTRSLVHLLVLLQCLGLSFAFISPLVLRPHGLVTPATCCAHRRVLAQCRMDRAGQVHLDKVESREKRDYLVGSLSAGEQTKQLLLQKLNDVDLRDHPCLEWSDPDGKLKTISHGEFAAGVASFVELFEELKLPPRRVVAVISGHRPEYHEVVAAALVTGLVPVGLPDPERWGSTIDTAEQLMESLDIGVVFTDADNFALFERSWRKAEKAKVISFDNYRSKVVNAKEVLERIPVVRGPDTSDDPTLLLSTSGTTGLPKAVILSEPMVQEYFESVGAIPKSVFLPVPPDCASGLLSLIHLLKGRTGRIMDVENERLEHLGSPHAEDLEGVFCAPAFLKMLIKRAENDPIWLGYFKKNIKSITCGLGHMPRGLLEKAHKVLGPSSLTYSYAATELGSVSYLNVTQILTSEEFNQYDKEKLLLTCGRTTQAPGMIRIYNPDTGEAYTEKETYDLDKGHEKFGGIIQKKFRATAVTPGYYKRPEKTAKLFMKGEQEGERWISSGDYGYFYKGGFLRVLGRLDIDVFRSHGYASAFGVEDILRMHPAVSDAAVCGIREPGEEQEDIVAFVIKEDPAACVDEQQLRHFVMGKMGSEGDRPLMLKAVHFVESFPLNSNLKESKVLLIERYLNRYRP